MRLGGLVAAAAAGCVAGMLGCGSSAPQQTLHQPGQAPAGQATDATQVVEGNALVRHELPPAGVRRQVEYVGGAGPLPCDTPHHTNPRVKIFTIGGPSAGETKEGVAEIGSELVVCTDGFPVDGEVSVEATGPGDRTLQSTAPSGPNFYRGATIQLLPGLPPGAYTVTAKLGSAHADGRLALKNASRPGLRVIHPASHPDNQALVIGVGLSHDTRVDVYRKEAGGPPNYGRYSDFVSSFPARTRADGTSTMLVSVPKSDPEGCWWLVVTVRGRSAEDELCD